MNRKFKVIVADDEKLIARNIANRIEQCGGAFEVVARAGTGAEALEGLGALLLTEPLSAEVIRSAVERLETNAHRLSPQRSAKLNGLMDRLGVPGHPGRAMLANAAALCWRDRYRLRNLRDRVYPDTARPLGKTGAQAERAIRHVIDAAWRTGEIDEQTRIFGDTIDARRGRPTCGEMIAQLADILRWEG